MKLGYIGLGKMGHNMVERLVKKGHEVFAFDIDEDARRAAEKSGAKIAVTLSELVGKLDTPKNIWIMVPHQTVDDVLSELVPFLVDGDTVIDGGNSPYKESMRRAGGFESTGINFVGGDLSQRGLILWMWECPAGRQAREKARASWWAETKRTLRRSSRFSAI